VRRQVFDWDSVTSDWKTTPTTDQLFIYDGWNLVMMLNALSLDASGQPKVMEKYTWGLDLSQSIHGAGGIGGLLAAVETQGTEQTNDDQRYWFMYDANGNVGQVLDATNTSNITIAATYEYDPYGNVINSSGAYKDTNPFKFSTKWFDAETGLGYWGIRYYDPKRGRWISRDPIEERGGLNLYRFVVNDPIEKIDPLGAQVYFPDIPIYIPPKPSTVEHLLRCCHFPLKKRPPMPPECDKMLARLRKCSGSDHGPFWNSGLCCQLMDFVCKEEKKDCGKDVDACWNANRKGGKSLNPCHFGGHVNDVCWMFEGATGDICKPHWGDEKKPNDKQKWPWMQNHLYMFKLCDTVEVKTCLGFYAASGVFGEKTKAAFPKFCIKGKGGKEACYKYCESTFVPPENQAECRSRCDATFVAPQTGPSSAP
jgi:RHS repeat-associated protein